MEQTYPPIFSQLKSLELQGYKTFASKTVFEFPVRITAIVGPNGAGKSNIADSLRWVLGEQTYSLLRGKRTLDMIFAGSEQKPRASMAACKVTFDNTSGWLPIDYEEVAITRRAYRDGQNEYLLNGQKVRLKQINELLASAGLAERTYTIIGQGLVDSALSLRPEERRKFFEEASGIGLYQTRREESLNRLEKTRRNLERVLDILGELEPRLKSLEKQAEKARDYERIESDLKILLREWYGFHWNNAQNELSHSMDLLKNQENVNIKSRQALLERNNQIDNLKSDVQGGRNSLVHWRSQLSEQNQKIEKIRRTLAVLDERTRSLQELSFRTENDLVRYLEELKVNNERRTALLDEINQIKSEKLEAEANHRVTNEIFLQRQDERKTLEVNLTRVKQQLLNSETEKIQANLHLQELENQERIDSHSIDSLTEKIRAEKEKLNEHKKELDLTNRQIKALEDSILDLREKNHNLEDSISGNQKDLNQLRDKRSDTDRDITRLSGQIDVIEQAEKKFTGFNKGTRTILSLKRDGKLRGDITVLGDQIEVLPGYEKVISAILGDFIDALVLRSEAESDQLLMILEKEEGSQTYLIPGDIAPGTNPDITPEDTGLVGNASAFIRVKPGFEGIVKALVGMTYIAVDRSAANRYRNFLENGFKIATLSGEVFFPSGVIFSANTGKEALVARPRLKRELLEKLSLLEETKNSSFQGEKALEEEIKTQRSEKAAIEKALRETNTDLDRLKKKHREVFLSSEVLTNSLAFYSQQLDEKNFSLKNCEAKKSGLNHRLSEIDEVIRTTKLDLSRLELELNRLPIQELVTELGHWETNIAVLTRALLDLGTRIDDLINNGSRIDQERQKLESMLSESRENLKLLENQKVEAEANKLQIDQEIKALNLQIQPMEDKLLNLQAELEDKQKQYNQNLQEASDAERGLIQAQMEMGRKKDRLESLRKKIEDDFGLVDFEYIENIVGPTPLPFSEFVQQLPIVPVIREGIEESINVQRAQLRRLGAINLDAQREYKEVSERFDFLSSQVSDLKEADINLQKVIAELDELMKNKFQQTFAAVAEEFKGMFTRLFGGGSASLVMLDTENPSETGIDIIARLPGRREQGLSLLSGGERSLTAVALIFSLLKISPTPFCVLDEVDAMLDEANVGRFCELLVELSKKTQFVVITHNRNTVQNADIIYGVTMGRDSASQVISLKLDDVDAVIDN